MASASILMYNCEGQDWVKLRNLMALLRLRLRPVKQDQYAVLLKDLAQGKGDVEATPYEGEGFTEPMVVLCNLHPAQRDPVLEVIRRAELPVMPIRAVLTATNMEWTSTQLYEELCRERAAMAEQQGQK